MFIKMTDIGRRKTLWCKREISEMARKQNKFRSGVQEFALGKVMFK
jgi:hypothetical protein